MIGYEKLPTGTSKKTTYQVMASGVFIGFGIAMQSFMAIYALGALTIALFFPDVDLHLTTRDTLLYVILALSSLLACLMLGYVAFFMDRLSKRALPFSRFTWIPIVVTYVGVALPRHTHLFSYRLGLWWALGCLAAIPLAGLYPYFFLRTKAARKLHSR